MQEIDLQSTQSEQERRQNEEIRQKFKLDDAKYNILLQMQKQVKQELETNADFQGQNRAKVTDVKHLLRQLNARDFNLDKTMEMWRNWLSWRKKYDIDNISIDIIESELKTGKAFWHKYDKEGNSCCVVRIKNHIAAETTHDKVMKFMIYLMEVGIKMCEKSGSEKMSVIWDREGFSSKNFDFTFITLMKSLVTMFQDNYAERLAHVFILYPSFIMKQAFNIFRPLLAEKVRNKIKIVNELSDLKQYFDEDCILKIHGGKSDFEYKYPDNVLCDPLNAVLPYIPANCFQNKGQNQSFSFQNNYENNDEFANQQENNRSSCFFSIENDSTEFFNIQNSQLIEENASNSNSKSSNNDFQDFDHQQKKYKQPRDHSPLNYKSIEQDQNAYQEDFEQIENEDYSQQKQPQLLKYNNLNTESNQVVSSGCCGCKSDNSCTIF